MVGTQLFSADPHFVVLSAHILYPPNLICYIGPMAYEVRHDWYDDWSIFATFATKPEAEAFRKEFLRRYKLYLEASGDHRRYEEGDVTVVERPLSTLEGALKAVRAIGIAEGFSEFVVDHRGEWSHLPDFMTFD